LYNVVYRWVWQEQEAMDLVQEAFTRLWEKEQRAGVDQARAYVYRTALNLAANRLRYNKLRKWVGVDAVSGLVSRTVSSEETLIRDEREQALRRAIEALPEKVRQVLLMCRFSQMSYAEVGQLLGIPEGTVASRHHKALSLLKGRLAGKEGDKSWI